MKKQVRLITEGAMMLAIIGLFLVLNMQSAGLLEVYLIWALPLPIIFYMVKYGIRNGFVLAAATMLLSLIVGNFITLFYVATAVIIGLTYGYGVVKDKTNGWLVFSTTLITAISLFIETYLLAAFFGYNLGAETQEILKALEQVEGLVVPADIGTLVMAVYPIAMLLMAFLQALITHIAAIALLKRLKIKTRKMRPIESFRLPKWAGALTLLGLFVSTLLARSDEESLRIIMILILTISSLVLIANAYILIMLFAKMTGKRWLPTFSLFALVLLPTMFIYVFIGLGLMDCFTDIRDRMIGSHR